MIQKDIITIGSVIYLRHVTTGAYLKSFPKRYTHKRSSTQQMVVASLDTSEENEWLVKRQHLLDGEKHDKTSVRHKEILRLEHVKTRSNLHSHGDRPSPITAQQEVTCLGINGKGDDNDDWIVEVENGEEWTTANRIRLIHLKTRRALHSHGNQCDPVFTHGEQEVTCYSGADDGDFWMAEIPGTGPVTATTKTPERSTSKETKRNKPDEAEPPSITEFGKWSVFHLVKDWPKLVKAPLGLFIVIATCLYIGFSIAKWLDTTKLEAKDAVLQAKEAVIDQKSNQLEDAHREVEKLKNQLASIKTGETNSAINEMMVIFQVLNLNDDPIKINPVCQIELREQFGGTDSYHGESPYRFSPKEISSTESDYTIAGSSARDFTFKIANDEKHRTIFARGAATLILTVWKLDGTGPTKAELKFTKETIHNKIVIRFK